MKYEQYKVPETGELFIKCINNDESISWIPTDEANSDYRAYLAWLETEDGQKYLAEQEAK